MSDDLPAAADVTRTGAEVERLLAELTGDPAQREQVERLVGLLVRLYGEGLARIVDVVASRLDDPTGFAALLAADELVSSLLILHGLHPVPVRERARAAIAGLGCLADGLRLVGVNDDGVAELELTPSGCASMSANRRAEIETAISVAVPDLTAVRVRELPRPKATPQVIPVSALFSRAVAR